MSELYIQLKIKLAQRWVKLLRAEAKHKTDKAAKHEQKIIELELQLKNLREQ
jgi:hypothetical protein